MQFIVVSANKVAPLPPPKTDRSSLIAPGGANYQISSNLFLTFFSRDIVNGRLDPLADTCNNNCECSTIYKPICTERNEEVYYSPCHAGCVRSKDKFNQGVNFLFQYFLL